MAKSRSESPARNAKGKSAVPGPGKIPDRISSPLTGED
jgi:hypothetical protein